METQTPRSWAPDEHGHGRRQPDSGGGGGDVAQADDVTLEVGGKDRRRFPCCEQIGARVHCL
eukprot:12887881-Prorocentrum_lima.AAC.1